jgi:hypothetical protein
MVLSHGFSCPYFSCQTERDTVIRLRNEEAINDQALRRIQTDIDVRSVTDFVLATFAVAAAFNNSLDLQPIIIRSNSCITSNIPFIFSAWFY